MPETLYAIGKAAALDGDAAASEKPGKLLSMKRKDRSQPKLTSVWPVCIADREDSEAEQQCGSFKSTGGFGATAPTNDATSLPATLLGYYISKYF